MQTSHSVVWRSLVIVLLALTAAPGCSRRLIGLPGSTPAATATSGGADGQYQAGLRIEQAEYVTPAGHTETLTMAVWYPTLEAESLFTYEVEQAYTSHVTFEAPLAEQGGPFPLVIYSHGLFSSGYSLAIFGEHLARHGFVMVAPDYIDTMAPDFTQPIAFSRIEGGRADPAIRVFAAAHEWIEPMNADPSLLLAYLAEHRLGQTRFVLDQALAWNMDAESPYFQAIDPNRIGIVGWSLGGLTALGLVGAHPDPAVRDTRIRAALLLSAPPYPFQDTLDNIGAPIMLMTGDQDEANVGPEYPRRLVYDNAPAPKYHLVLDNTTHYDFGNRPASNLPLDEAIAAIPGLNAIAEYGLAFLEAYVGQDASAVARLDASHPALEAYEEEE